MDVDGQNREEYKDGMKGSEGGGQKRERERERTRQRARDFDCFGFVWVVMYVVV